MFSRLGSRTIHSVGSARQRLSRPRVESLESRVVLSSWTQVPISSTVPRATVLLSDGRLLIEQSDTTRWWLVSPDASGNYADPAIKRAHDSYYIHNYAGMALLKDGEVMVSGSEYPATDSAYNGQDHIEIYNPTLDSWRIVAKPTFFGSKLIVDNSIKVLPDGRVLASTGNSALYGLYDPTSESWTQVQSLPMGSTNEVTLTMLDSGAVLAVGTGAYGNLSWLFDEATLSWTEVGQTPGTLNTGEGGPMVQLPDGKILAVGAVPYWGITQTAIYSPTTQTWTTGAPIVAGSIGQVVNLATVEHSYKLVPRLAPGLALEVQNGSSANGSTIDVGAWSQADQQVWQFGNADSAKGIYVLVPTNALNSALTAGNPVDLSTTIGGVPQTQRWLVHENSDGYFTLSPSSSPGSSLDFSQGPTSKSGTVALDAANGSIAQEWQLVENPNTSIGDEPLAALPSGNVLVAMRQGNQSAFYEYSPTAGSWTPVTNFPDALTSDYRVDLMNMTVLPSGQVLVTAPKPDGSGSEAFLFTPDGQPQTAWKPKLLAITPVAPGSSTQWISGWGLNGVSEGGVFGDDNSASSNYPLIQLTNRFGRVTYAKTANWTTTQVGPNFEAFQFTPPPNLPYGDYSLRVIASGIASEQITYDNTLNPSGQGVMSGAIYKLVPEDNPSLALTLSGGSKPSAVPWSGLASQRWVIQSSGSGLFTIALSNAPQNLLDAPAALGNPVSVGKPTGTVAQEWTISPSGDGSYDISPQSNPLATLGDGRPASLVIDTSAASQRWQLVLVDTIANGHYRLTPGDLPNKALTIESTAPSALSPAAVTRWRGGTGQEWNLTNVGGGYVTLAPLNAPNSRLEVIDHATGAGSTTVIGPASASLIDQEWRVILNVDGSFRLIPRLAGTLSLDSNAITRRATMPVQINRSNGSRSQEWNLKQLAVADPLKASSWRVRSSCRTNHRLSENDLDRRALIKLQASEF